MILSIIVARASNGVIGNKGALPWHIPPDLKHFKTLTVGKPIVMGRRTFISIGKPLPGRHNIVMTRDCNWTQAGVTIVPNLAEAIAAAGLDLRTRAEEIMVIGGAAVYAEALPSTLRIYLTEVHAAPEGDTLLPPFEPATWSETVREDHDSIGEMPGYSFVTLERRR